jgi:hypothetical protein
MCVFRKQYSSCFLEMLAHFELDKATHHTSYWLSLPDTINSARKPAKNSRPQLFWRHMPTGIVASHDSPVDIPHAARAAADTSGLFPAVKAGIDMPAKKTDCFSC